MRHHAKCCADRSNRCRDIVISKVLRCRPLPSWISLDLKFVTDQTVTRAELRHRAKFRRNRWNCGRDMTIFWFFKMAAAAMLDFLNYKVLTVGTHLKCRIASPCQISWIGQTVVAISRFWIFQDVGSHNLGFLIFNIFNDPNGREHELRYRFAPFLR